MCVSFIFFVCWFFYVIRYFGNSNKKKYKFGDLDYTHSMYSIVVDFTMSVSKRSQIKCHNRILNYDIHVACLCVRSDAFLLDSLLYPREREAERPAHADGRRAESSGNRFLQIWKPYEFLFIFVSSLSPGPFFFILSIVAVSVWVNECVCDGYKERWMHFDCSQHGLTRKKNTFSIRIAHSCIALSCFS